jgi:stage V sporulation protein D (sporulation-specific penicillin-binding protein)
VTGTAQQVVAGRYSAKNYVATFAGFAPLPEPRVTILVKIDGPRGGPVNGGEVAAPLFKSIAQQVLNKVNVPKSY